MVGVGARIESGSDGASVAIKERDAESCAGAAEVA
jgi:hypothetical protein